MNLVPDDARWRTLCAAEPPTVNRTVRHGAATPCSGAQFHHAIAITHRCDDGATTTKARSIGASHTRICPSPERFAAVASCACRECHR